MPRFIIPEVPLNPAIEQEMREALRHYQGGPSDLRDSSIRMEHRERLWQMLLLGCLRIRAGRVRAHDCQKSGRDFEIPEVVHEVSRCPQTTIWEPQGEFDEGVSAGPRLALRQTADSAVGLFRKGDRAPVLSLLEACPAYVYYPAFHPELVRCLIELLEQNLLQFRRPQARRSRAATRDISEAQRVLLTHGVEDDRAREFIAIMHEARNVVLGSASERPVMGWYLIPPWRWPCKLTEPMEARLRKRLSARYAGVADGHKCRKRAVALARMGDGLRRSVLQAVPAHVDEIGAAFRAGGVLPATEVLERWMDEGMIIHRVVAEVLARYSPRPASAFDPASASRTLESTAQTRWPALCQEKGQDRLRSAVTSALAIDRQREERGHEKLPHEAGEQEQ